MKKKVLALSVLLVSLCFSCNKSSSDVEPCGPMLVKEKQFNQTADIITNSELWTETNILTTLYGTERTFSIMTELTELCPEKLTDLNFEVKTAGKQVGDVVADMEGKAVWAGTTKKAILCKKTDGNIRLNHTYSSYLSVDLKSAFNSEAATVKGILTISFHSLGSTEQDIAYFRSAFKELNIGMAGYAY